MKFTILLTLLSFIAIACSEQQKIDDDVAIVEKELIVEEEEMAYDSVYAASLGADDLGMKRYVMAFLKSGPNRDQDSTAAVKIQQAHMQNIQRMAEEGQLIVAGPFLDEGDIRGIYLFNVETVEEAKALTETDPAIQAGRLEMELHPWYGSAALMEINDIHSKISKSGM